MREKPLQKAPPAELAALNRTRAFSHINNTTAGLAALYHTSSSLPHPCFLTDNQSHPNPRQRKKQLSTTPAALYHTRASSQATKAIPTQDKEKPKSSS